MCPLHQMEQDKNTPSLQAALPTRKSPRDDVPKGGVPQGAHLPGHVQVHEDDIKGIRAAALQNCRVGLLAIKSMCHLNQRL